MKRFPSFKALIEAFGAKRLADAVGVPPGHVRIWSYRNSIPAAHYGPVVRAGLELSVSGVTFEELSRLAAKRQGNPPSRSQRDAA